jgi:hypothetical protein
MKSWRRILLKPLLAFARNFIGTIPPHDLTKTRIGVIEIRIRSYWKANGHLPGSLSDLPVLPRRDNSVMDGWGTPIKYEITGATTFTLSSPGPEASTAAAGANQAIEVALDART